MYKSWNFIQNLVYWVKFLWIWVQTLNILWRNYCIMCMYQYMHVCLCECFEVGEYECELRTSAKWFTQNTESLQTKSPLIVKKTTLFGRFFKKSLAKTFIFVDYIIQCYLVSLSVDNYLHLRQDSQQVCPKVLVWYVKSFFKYTTLECKGSGLNFFDNHLLSTLSSTMWWIFVTVYVGLFC